MSARGNQQAIERGFPINDSPGKLEREEARLVRRVGLRACEGVAVESPPGSAARLQAREAVSTRRASRACMRSHVFSLIGSPLRSLAQVVSLMP